MKKKKLIEPIADALESYRDGYMAAKNSAPRTRVDYETDVTQFLEYLQGNNVKDQRELAPGDVTEWLANYDKPGLAKHPSNLPKGERSYGPWLRRLP